MSADEFWHGDLELVQAYIKADTIRRHNLYWAELRQGAYIQIAIASVLDKDTQYPERPIVAEMQPTQEELEKQAALEMREKMQAMVDRFNEKFLERQRLKEEANTGNDE